MRRFRIGFKILGLGQGLGLGLSLGSGLVLGQGWGLWSYTHLDSALPISLMM